jgi:hypothetical protein
MRIVLAYPEDADSEASAALAEQAALEVCRAAYFHPYMAWHDYTMVYSGLNLPSAAFANAELAGAFVWIEAIAAAQEFLSPPKGAKVEIDVLFEPGDEHPPAIFGPGRAVLRDHMYLQMCLAPRTESGAPAWEIEARQSQPISQWSELGMLAG